MTPKQKLEQSITWDTESNLKDLKAMVDTLERYKNNVQTVINNPDYLDRMKVLNCQLQMRHIKGYIDGMATQLQEYSTRSMALINAISAYEND